VLNASPVTDRIDDRRRPFEPALRSSTPWTAVVSRQSFETVSVVTADDCSSEETHSYRTQRTPVRGGGFSVACEMWPLSRGGQRDRPRSAEDVSCLRGRSRRRSSAGIRSSLAGEDLSPAQLRSSPVAYLSSQFAGQSLSPSFRRGFPHRTGG